MVRHTQKVFTFFLGLFLHECQIGLARVLINSSMSAQEVAAIACGDNRPAVLTSFLGGRSVPLHAGIPPRSRHPPTRGRYPPEQTPPWTRGKPPTPRADTSGVDNPWEQIPPPSAVLVGRYKQQAGGVIQSLNYPNGPEPGILCEYVIDIRGVNPKSGVAVMVRHFNTEPDFDVVKIYKGEGASSDRLIHTLSGSVRSGTTYESADETQLTITFENDCFTSYLKGFEFVYYSLDGSEDAQANAQKASGEGGVVLLVNEANPTAFIESPNFPDVYPRGTSCVWVVKSDCRGRPGNLTLTSLRFETKQDDWLDVYRDRGSQEQFLQRIDGQHNEGFEVDIGYGTMQVRFTTNSRYGDNGFRLAVHFTEQ